MKRKNWLEKTNERTNSAIVRNQHRPGLYAIPSEDCVDFGFCREGVRGCYQKAERDLRKKNYSGEIIFFNYLDPRRTYIFKAA